MIQRNKRHLPDMPKSQNFSRHDGWRLEGSSYEARLVGEASRAKGVLYSPHPAPGYPIVAYEVGCALQTVSSRSHGVY